MAQKKIPLIATHIGLAQQSAQSARAQTRLSLMRCLRRLSSILILALAGIVSVSGIVAWASVGADSGNQATRTRTNDSDKANKNRRQQAAQTRPRTTLVLSLDGEIALDPAEAIIPVEENVRLVVKTERWRFYKITPPPPHQIKGITETEEWHNLSESLSLNFQILLAPSADLKIELASSQDAPRPEAVVLVGFEPVDDKFRVTLKEGTSGIARELEQSSAESPGFINTAINLVGQYKMWLAGIALLAVAGIALLLFLRRRKNVFASPAQRPVLQPPFSQSGKGVASDASQPQLAFAAGAGSNPVAPPVISGAKEELPRAELSSLSPPLPEDKGPSQQPGQGLDFVIQDQKAEPEPVISAPSFQEPDGESAPPENQIPLQQREESGEPDALKYDKPLERIFQFNYESALFTKRRLDEHSAEIREIIERVRDIELQMNLLVERLEDKMEDVFLKRLVVALYQENPELQERVSEAEQEISNLVSRSAAQEVNLEAALQQTDKLREAVEAILTGLRQRGNSATTAIPKVAVVLNNMKLLINELGDWQSQRSQQKIKLRFAIDIPTGEAGGRAILDALSGSLSSQIKKMQNPEGYFRSRLEQIATSQVMHLSDVCDQEIDQRRENAELQALLKNLFDAAGMEEISARRNEPFRPGEQKVVQFVPRQSADDRIEAVASLVTRGFRYKDNIVRKAYVMLFN